MSTPVTDGVSRKLKPTGTDPPLRGDGHKAAKATKKRAREAREAREAEQAAHEAQDDHDNEVEDPHNGDNTTSGVEPAYQEEEPDGDQGQHETDPDQEARAQTILENTLEFPKILTRATMRHLKTTGTDRPLELLALRPTYFDIGIWDSESSGSSPRAGSTSMDTDTDDASWSPSQEDQPMTTEEAMIESRQREKLELENRLNQFGQDLDDARRATALQASDAEKARKARAHAEARAASLEAEVSSWERANEIGSKAATASAGDLYALADNLGERLDPRVLNKPPPYEGSRDRMQIEDWLNTVQAFLTATGTPKSRMVAAASTYLRGAAAKHWMFEEVTLGRNGADPTDWAVFSRRMKARFDTADREEKARHDLDTLQQGNSSASSYTNRYEDLLHLIPTMSEPDKIWHYFHHMHPSLKNKCSLNPRTGRKWVTYEAARNFVLAYAAATDFRPNPPNPNTPKPRAGQAATALRNQAVALEKAGREWGREGPWRLQKLRRNELDLDTSGNGSGSHKDGDTQGIAPGVLAQGQVSKGRLLYLLEGKLPFSKYLKDLQHLPGHHCVHCYQAGHVARDCKNHPVMKPYDPNFKRGGKGGKGKAGK